MATSAAGQHNQMQHWLWRGQAWLPLPLLGVLKQVDTNQALDG
jgi:hypothetical protein